MNSIELINAAIHFEKADRTPVIAQVFGHAATFAGKALGDYVCDTAGIPDSVSSLHFPDLIHYYTIK